MTEELAFVRVDSVHNRERTRMLLLIP